MIDAISLSKVCTSSFHRRSFSCVVNCNLKANLELREILMRGRRSKGQLQLGGYGVDIFSTFETKHNYIVNSRLVHNGFVRNTVKVLRDTMTNVFGPK